MSSVVDNSQRRQVPPPLPHDAGEIGPEAALATPTALHRTTLAAAVRALPRARSALRALQGSVARRATAGTPLAHRTPRPCRRRQHSLPPSFSCTFQRPPAPYYSVFCKASLSSRKALFVSTRLTAVDSRFTILRCMIRCGIYLL